MSAVIKNQRTSSSPLLNLKMTDTSVPDVFFDSEDLIGWLLLNPEMSDFDNCQSPLYPSSDTFFTASADIKEEEIDVNDNSSTDSNDKSSRTLKRSKSEDDSDDRSSNKKDKSMKGGPKKRQKGEAEKDIEARVSELKKENAELQAHLTNVTQRTTEVQKQRTAMEIHMTSILQQIGDKDDADQTELEEIVKQYTEIYADYGKCRQREVSFHVNQLEKLIVPTKTTKMCLWALQQDKSFYQKSKSPMYDMLSKELEITPEQTERIQERREKIVSLLRQLNESLTLLQSFKTAIEKKHTSYDKICGRVQSAATPKQVVLFLLWITKNADKLVAHIPGFSRSTHHTPNVEFIPHQNSTNNGSSSNPSNSKVGINSDTTVSEGQSKSNGVAIQSGGSGRISRSKSSSSNIASTTVPKQDLINQYGNIFAL